MGFLVLFEAFCCNFSLNANISFLKSVYVHYSGIRCLLKVLVYDNKASSCFFYRGKNFNWLTILVVQLVFLLAFISISKVLYSMCVCVRLYIKGIKFTYRCYRINHKKVHWLLLLVMSNHQHHSQIEKYEIYTRSFNNAASRFTF